MPFSPATWPVPLDPGPLEGRLVRLEPLSRSHEPELAKAAEDERIWRYLTSFAGSRDAMHEYLEALLGDRDAGTALPFVVRERSSGRLVGMTRLKNLSAEHRRAFTGSWLVPSAWGSGANAESKLLLLEYAFESLQCLRIEFHTDSRNARSRAALTRMGAAEEGVLRSYIAMRDGTRRDTVVLSVLAHEWPEVKRRLTERLRRQAAARDREGG